MGKRSAGFTLVELMIVVVIIGILAMIGYPSYQKHMQKTRRADAQTMLTDMAARQERWFSNNNSYTSTLTNLGYANAANQPTEQGYYQISAVGNATTFTLTATPVAGGPQAGDSACPTITLDATGAMGPSAACWNR